MMFKMVIVVNTSLKMSTGKIASQTAHSAVSLYVKAQQSGKKSFLIFDHVGLWLRTGQAKVVLKGRDETHLSELEKSANQIGLITSTVRDAGRTQVASGSLTCLAIFGKVSEIDRVTGSLPLYH